MSEYTWIGEVPTWRHGQLPFGEYVPTHFTDHSISMTYLRPNLNRERRDNGYAAPRATVSVRGTLLGAYGLANPLRL